MDSLWIDRTSGMAHSPLSGDVEADVVIIGAGITGLMCALQASASGRRVVVLEAAEVGGANTGRSTGNLYATVSGGLAKLREKWSAEQVQAVVAARLAAVRHIAAVCERMELAADLVLCPMHIGASDPEWEEWIERERAACAEAGLHAEREASLQVGRRAVTTALRIDDQAQCNPHRLATGLALALRQAGVCIHASSPVTMVDANPGCVQTALGRVRAPWIVMATHSPLGFNLVQAEMKPLREYAVSARDPEVSLSAGIHWLKDAGRSVRSYGGRLVVVGGKHVTGAPEPGIDYPGQLQAFAREVFGASDFDHVWSAQQFESADGLPYIGRSAHDNVLIATGFGADGLVWGTVAAQLLGELIDGRDESDLVQLLRPRRFTPVKSARGWASENASVVRHFVGDRLRRGEARFSDVPAGSGRIVEIEGSKYAVYRNDAGRVHVLSPVCPHLKCLVAWNALESTWDCPCHGSRFHADGRVLEGPAASGLDCVSRDGEAEVLASG